MQRRLVRITARWDMPAGAVYIGRPTLLGNPYTIGRDGSRDEVVEKYREYFARMLRQPGFVDRVLRYVGDFDLACWCPPKPCHGEVILSWLNSLESPPTPT